MNRQREHFQTGNVLLISIAHFVHDVYSSFLAPILPLLIDKLAINYTLAGFLTVAQRAPSLFNPFMGLLADRIRVRYLLILAPAITSVAMSLLGCAPSYGLLVLLLLAMGVGGMCFHVPGPVMIRAVSGDRVGRGMSFFMLGGELARTVGPVVILAAVSWWGLDGTWRLIPFGLAASFLLFLRFRKLAVHVDRVNDTARAPLAQALRRLAPFLTILAGFTISRAFLKSALTIFLPVFLAGRGENLWFAGVSLSVLEFTGAIGTFWGGDLSDRLGRRNTLLLVSIASPALAWVFLMTSGWLSLSVLLVLGFFLFAGGPVVLALVQDVHCERRSFLNGMYMTLNFAGSSVTALGFGWMADTWGMETAFRVATVLSLLAVAFLWRLSDRHLLQGEHSPEAGDE